MQREERHVGCFRLQISFNKNFIALYSSLPFSLQRITSIEDIPHTLHPPSKMKDVFEFSGSQKMMHDFIRQGGL
jgi:hypothetical protein